MGLWRRISLNKLLVVANVAFLVYQCYHYSTCITQAERQSKSSTTEEIKTLRIPDCPKPKTIVEKVYVTRKEEPPEEQPVIYIPKSDWKWDFNWDGREASPGAVIKSRATRYIYMVRHGQYYGYGPEEGHLSVMGKEQARVVGGYLQSLNYTWNRLIASTSTRAAETADIIHRNYFSHMDLERSDLLKEGWPTFPEPPFPNWDESHPSFAIDGKRIAKAFQKFIHRAEPNQREDSNELIIAHGNVISYFILRSLQLPAERWLKIAVLQGSITVFMIGPDGHVTFKYVGDVGFIPKNMWSG